MARTPYTTPVSRTALRRANEDDQRTFFAVLYGTPQNTGYTIDRWESIPKFRLAHLRYQTAEIEAWETSFVLDSVEIPVSIEPGVVKRGNGKKRYGVIPGIREELVWRVLLEMAAEQQRERGLFDRSGSAQDKQLNIYVYFTLDELRRRLEDRGKSYKLSELREALLVLHSAKITIPGRVLWPDDQGKANTTTPLNYVSELYFKGEILPDGTVAHRCLAALNSFATAQIMQLRCFPVDNQAVIALCLPLARWLLTRLSHRFRQADQADSFTATSGYNLSLATILAESGIQNEKRQRAVIERVREALNELHRAGHLQEHKPFDEDVRHAPATGRGRPAVSDVVWTLYPSYTLVDKIITGNTFVAQRREALGGRGERGLRGVIQRPALSSGV